METIVLGYDDGDGTKHALARASSLARALGAKLVVLSVARPATTHARGLRTIDLVDAPARHRRRLENARMLLEETDVDAHYEVGFGEPADVIVDVSDARNADLIVLGSNDAGLLTRLFGLSVGDAVRKRARCDVLVVG